MVKTDFYIRLIFAMLLAFTVSSFVYFGFVNSYSSGIFNHSAFIGQFESGIYQYRILSGYFLLWIYDFLGNLNLNYEVFKFKFLNAESEPQMFLSFYLLNTFFLMLSAVMMVLITESGNFIATTSEKVMTVATGIFIIGLSQFVIVPYDVSSYFFLLLFFWIFLKYLKKQSAMLLAFLAVTVAVSTLNRESSALSMSLAATLLFGKFGLRKETVVPVAVLGITFMMVYLGMRFLNESFTTNDGSLLTENFTQPKNLLGMLFWAVLFALSWLLAKDRAAKRNIILFHTFALPYLAMCFYSGILYEVRLYVPVFLNLLFLTKITLDEQSQ